MKIALVVYLCLSSVAFAQGFLTLKGIAMPNQNFQSEGYTITLMRQTVDLEMGNIEVDTEASQVAATIELKDIRYRIGQLRVHKKRPTDCFNTTVFIANGDALPLSFELPVLVANGKLALGEIKTEFEIPSGEYASQGPDYCVGGLFPGIVRRIVAKAIANSRETVEAKIEEAIQQIAALPKPLPKPLAYNDASIPNVR